MVCCGSRQKGGLHCLTSCNYVLVSVELLEFSKRNVKIWLHFRLKNDVKESLNSI